MGVTPSQSLWQEQSAVRAYLDRLIREHGSTYAELSKWVGRNQTYIQQFIRRGVPRKLPEDVRGRIAAYFGVPEDRLGLSPAGAGRVLGYDSNQEHVEVFADSPASAMRRPYRGVGLCRASATDYVLPPTLLPDGRIESSCVTSSKSLLDDIVFQISWLQSLASQDVGDVVAFRVTEDCMAPTLPVGSGILVDTADRAMRDGIFAFKVNSVALVRRVITVRPEGRMMVRCDNQLYSSSYALPENCSNVIGRVVWVGLCFKSRGARFDRYQPSPHLSAQNFSKESEP